MISLSSLKELSNSRTPPTNEVEFEGSCATTSDESYCTSSSLLTDEDECCLFDSEELAIYLEEGKRVIQAEAHALQVLSNNMDATSDFARTVALLRRTIGRVVVTGVGKSGIIGQKICATFASTGTPSFFVHSGDAAHGDLGMITQEDVVLAISKSGESNEFFAIIQYCARLGIPLIAVTQKPQSSLGRAAKYRLLLPNVPEACNMKVAPTTSSTATLAIGDALAVALSKARTFSLKDFCLFHPGGNLGRLAKRVDAVMHKAVPLCPREGTTIVQALMTMATQRKGCVGIVNDAGECGEQQQVLVGIITESDLENVTDMSSLAHEIMSPCTITADPRESAYDVLQRMSQNNLSVIFVIHPSTKIPIGVIHIQDLLGCK
jgi:arabinose-5-phosphate isomerase